MKSVIATYFLIELIRVLVDREKLDPIKLYISSGDPLCLVSMQFWILNRTSLNFSSYSLIGFCVAQYHSFRLKYETPNRFHLNSLRLYQKWFFSDFTFFFFFYFDVKTVYFIYTVCENWILLPSWDPIVIKCSIIAQRTYIYYKAILGGIESLIKDFSILDLM